MKNCTQHIIVKTLTLLVTGMFIFFGGISNRVSLGEELRFYIGTYTGGGKSQGIYTAKLNTQSGAVSIPVLAAQTVNPSFLAVHPSGKYLYSSAVISGPNKKRAGAISAFSIDPSSGLLKSLGELDTTGGTPCHLTVDRKGKFVLFANYGGGNVGAMTIQPDGRLGRLSGFVQHEGSSILARQKGPHAHSINIDSNNRFAVAADLGLDQLITYTLTEKGELKPSSIHKEKPGAGPRHFVFHPNGKNGYLLNEMNATVSALKYDPEKGQFESIHTLSTLPDGYEGRKSCAEVRIHPNGKFLYCSNRGDDSIAVYQVAEDGTLSRIEIVKTGGKEPRNFNLDPTGKFLLAENQKSDSITVFRINQENGKLESTGQVVEVGRPVCIRFLPSK